MATISEMRVRGNNRKIKDEKAQNDILEIRGAMNSESFAKKLTPAYLEGKIGSDGSVVSDSSKRYIPYANIEEYEFIKIQVSVSDGYIAFYNSAYSFISSKNLADYQTGMFVTFRKPTNAVYVRFTASIYASVNAKDFYVEYLLNQKYEDVSMMLGILDGINTSNGYSAVIPGYAQGKIGSDGTVVSDNTVYYSDYVSLTGYEYAAYRIATNTGHIAFYDENKAFISAESLGGKTVGEMYLFKKPAGAEYYRTTVSTWFATNNQPLMRRTNIATLEDVQRVYKVEKDGSGDFTSLVDAVREAIQHENSKVYVGDGVWDIIDELGPDYISGVYVGQRGLYLQNGIHLICSSKSIIKAEYTGDIDEVKTWLAVFNSGPKGFTLENATLVGKNIRYVVHDERDYTDPELYVNKYINCKMYLDNSGNNAWDEMQCIGGGLGINGYIEVDGCYFESEVVSSKTAPYVITAWHNSQDLNNLSAKSHLLIKDSYFAGEDCTFRITGMGNSTEVSDVVLTNCSLGADAIHAGTNNVRLIKWNNEIRA